MSEELEHVKTDEDVDGHVRYSSFRIRVSTGKLNQLLNSQFKTATLALQPNVETVSARLNISDSCMIARTRDETVTSKKRFDDALNISATRRHVLAQIETSETCAKKKKNRQSDNEFDELDTRVSSLEKGVLGMDTSASLYILNLVNPGGLSLREGREYTETLAQVYVEFETLDKVVQGSPDSGSVRGSFCQF